MTKDEVDFLDHPTGKRMEVNSITEEAADGATAKIELCPEGATHRDNQWRVGALVLLPCGKDVIFYPKM